MTGSSTIFSNEYARIDLVGKWRRWLQIFDREGDVYGQFIKIYGKEGLFLTAFEVVQIIFFFASFSIELIGLCYLIFKDGDKKK